MDKMDWVTDDKVPVWAVVSGCVDGSPWPVAVASGNLHFFSGGTDDADLRCIPLNADGTLNPGDTVVVDFDMIEVELADACRGIATALRHTIDLDLMEADRDGIAPTVRIPDWDAEVGRDVSK